MSILTKLALFSALLLFLSPLPGRADTARSPIQAEARAVPEEVTIADEVIFSIVVQHDPEIRVTPPDPSGLFTGFELVDRSTAPARRVDGQVVDEFRFHLRAERVGHYTIPQVPVEFSAPDPGQSGRTIPGQLQAPSATIVVRSVLYDDGEPTDIRNLKPIVGEGSGWRRYLPIVLAALAGLGLWLAFLRWLRPGPATPAAAPVAPSLSAAEQARRELDALLARRWIEQGRFREHYFELSEIFRRYLATVYDIPAPDWTTEEITSALRAEDADDAPRRRRVLTLLQNTDRIKFAKAAVDADLALGHIDAIRDFIGATSPPDPAEAPEAIRSP